MTGFASPCNCIGPQNGLPACPCRMRDAPIVNGRYVRILDLGQAPSHQLHIPRQPPLCERLGQRVRDLHSSHDLGPSD